MDETLLIGRLRELWADIENLKDAPGPTGWDGSDNHGSLSARLEQARWMAGRLESARSRYEALSLALGQDLVDRGVALVGDDAGEAVDLVIDILAIVETAREAREVRREQA